MNKLSYIIVLSAVILSLASCANRQQQKKELLLETIEKYHVDTIDVTNKEKMGTESLDEILRHYPELYHAAEKARDAYKKWNEKETTMVSVAFVGNAPQRKAMAEKLAQNLYHHMDEYNVTSLLEYALLSASSDEKGEAEWADDTEISDLYLSLITKVKSDITATNDHMGTDDIKSSIGHARRAWSEYTKAIKNVLPAVPAEAQPLYIHAFNKLVHQHLTDLQHRYAEYHHTPNPDWME